MKCFIHFHEQEGSYSSADRVLAYMVSKAALAEVSFNVPVQSKTLLVQIQQST